MTSAAEEQNEKAFKHLFNETLLQQLAELIRPEYPEFSANALYNLTLDFPQLEMKARVCAIRDVLFFLVFIFLMDSIKNFIVYHCNI
ncbi:hypothetical protein MMK73_000280 [Providencia rettgeri]